MSDKPTLLEAVDKLATLILDAETPKVSDPSSRLTP